MQTHYSATIGENWCNDTNYGVTSRCNERKKVQRAEIMENITIIWLFITRNVTSLHINVPEKNITIIWLFISRIVTSLHINVPD